MDKLTERLAVALRAIAQTPIDGESLNEMLAREHEARRLAREALAAYDERVEAEGRAARTGGFAWACAADVAAAAARAHMERPSVGRRVRSLGGDGTSLAAGLEAVITEMRRGWPGTVDGKDGDGDYWAKSDERWHCIGRPGIDFEFVD